VYGFKALAHQPYERVEPLGDGGGLQNDEVDVVAQAYVLLLMSEYEATVVGVVVVAHHNIAEKTERACGIVGENYGVAAVVGDVLALAQTQHQTYCLNQCCGEYCHGSKRIYADYNVGEAPHRLLACVAAYQHLWQLNRLSNHVYRRVCALRNMNQWDNERQNQTAKDDYPVETVKGLLLKQWHDAKVEHC